jgi:transcriptional regulator with XRE-family HTH domain
VRRYSPSRSSLTRLNGELNEACSFSFATVGDLSAQPRSHTAELLLIPLPCAPGFGLQPCTRLRLTRRTDAYLAGPYSDQVPVWTPDYHVYLLLHRHPARIVIAPGWVLDTVPQLARSVEIYDNPHTSENPTYLNLRHNVCVGGRVWTMSSEREFNERLGARVRGARLGKSMSQDQLATLIGVPRTSLISIEQGKQRITAYQLVLLADSLSVNLDELVDSARADATSKVALPKSAPDSVRHFVARVQSAAKAQRRTT